MLQALIVIITTLANILIAILIFTKNSKSATHRLLSSLSIITAIWTIANFLALQPGSEATRLFWVRSVMFITSPYGTIILLLANTYPNKDISLSKIIKNTLLAFNAIVATLAFSPYMFSKLTNISDDSFSLTPGPAIILYAIGFLGFMTIGFIRLFRKFKISQGILRKQLGLFIWGIIISFSLLSFTNFVAVVVFGSIQLTSLGPPFTLILFTFTAYAIFKHKFLDISLIIFRSVSYVILTTVIVSIYATTLFTLSNLVPEKYYNSATILLGLILVYSFNPLKRLIENLTKNFLYKQPYVSEKLLENLGETISSTLSLDLLSKKVLNQITKTINITWGAVVIDNKISQDQDSQISSKTVGLGHKLSLSKNTLHNIKSITGRNVTLFDNLEEGPEKMLLRHHNISVVLPLIVKNTFHGLLILGEKSSGEAYNSQDIGVLEILVPQMSIAVQNALSFEEISHFNITLREEVKAATKKLRLSNKELKKLDKLKDDFIYIATHELKNPVTAMKGYLSLMKDDVYGHIPKKLQGPVEQLNRSSHELVVLINDLLQIAKIEADSVTLDIESFCICSMTDAVLGGLIPLAEQKSLKLTHSCPQKSPEVKADKNKVREVLNNLISNAIKYTPEGSITISHEKNGNLFTTHVKDTGSGITKADQKKLFSRFYRVEREAAKGIPGTGLGLYISKQLVEKMGGDIWLESELDKGTTFSFSLPIS